MKIEKIFLLVAALVLCAFLAVRGTFAWFASNTSKMTVVGGDADLDVTFYRLRDFNRDGAYNYNDYVNDVASVQSVIDVVAFTEKLKAAGNVTEITAENFAAAFAALPDADVMKFAYETDFTKAVSDVRMGSSVVYRVRVANNSERAADAALSLSNLMKYYYSEIHMQNYLTSGSAATSVVGDNGDNIENYAAKFLFTLTYTDKADGGAEKSVPLWNASQSETVTVVRVGAKASADIDFSLVFDGRSEASRYLTYVTDKNGECYRECLGIAERLSPTDAADFTDRYLKSVYEAEMNYLFSSASGEGAVAREVNLRLDFIKITGSLIGEAV